MTGACHIIAEARHDTKLTISILFKLFRGAAAKKKKRMPCVSYATPHAILAPFSPTGEHYDFGLLRLRDNMGADRQASGTARAPTLMYHACRCLPRPRAMMSISAMPAAEGWN